MAIIKCKMCGGDIQLAEDRTFGTCEYCCSVMTLPKVSDEQRAVAFNRGNAFRRAGEFDKALAVYERIVAEDDTDAEAHWCCALCRFGIEYVEDPATLEYIPTCHRASFDSFLEDVDYLAALEHSDGLTKRQYQKDAMKIADVQRGILATSQNETPYDVFLCYKETDDATKQRTRDSIDAQDIYYQLTQEGYRVFFSRITLEDVAGTQYEPYIFAALNSAKVMIAVGSKPEYFNAVWVKNEWSRFLALMRKDRTKLLLPCYKDMDPYDLPEQLSVLQSYDMAKIGFMQDLIRGVRKVLEAGKEKTPVAAPAAAPVEQPAAPTGSTAPLLKRAFMFLEDGEWNSANEYCEKVLDQDPENAEAYLGKLMAEQHVRRREALKDCAKPFDGSNSYQKAIRFGDSAMRSELESAVKQIKERIAAEEAERELQKKTADYEAAVHAMQSSVTEGGYLKAADRFREISGFKDAGELAKQCDEKAEVCRKDGVYAQAKRNMVGEADPSRYETAIGQFSTIPGWKDADEQIKFCKRKIEEIKARQEADRIEAERNAEEQRKAAEAAAKKRKKVLLIAASAVAVCIAGAIVFASVFLPNMKYNAAVALAEQGDVIGAYESLIALNGYKDSAEKAEEISVKYGKEIMKIAAVGDVVDFGAYEQDNDTSNGTEKIEWLVLDKSDDKVLLISKYALDCQQYNSTEMGVTWETCSLREWLNGTFLNAAFSKEEQNNICTSTVTADKNLSYSVLPGNDTTDKVFCLSIREAKEYFDSESARQCKATVYAYSQGAYKSSNGNCWWWLRSPGSSPTNAAGVRSGGSVNNIGFGFCGYEGAVRPAIWVSLEP